MDIRTRITATVLMLGGVAATYAQTCIGSIPAAPNCQAPHVLPGEVGHHVVLMDTSTATGSSIRCNGISTSHEVWFELVPLVSGPIEISTCHPATGFDTVLEVFRGGDANCDFMETVQCNDDSPEDEACVLGTGCPGTASKVRFQAYAGERFRIVVGRFGTGTCGNDCLGLVTTVGVPCGDAPRNLVAETAVAVPGAPGSYTVHADVTDAITLPSEPQPNCVGPDIGHTVWYQVTPQRTGRIRATTCNPGTNYDTVMVAYQQFAPGVFLQLDCGDDTNGDAACVDACVGGFLRSRVAFDVDAGSTYYVQIGSYAGALSTCFPRGCLEATFDVEDLCDYDTTPPEARLSNPADLACGCTSVPITGTARDTDGVFDAYVLEYRSIGGATWTMFHGASTPVSNGTLGTWNTNGLPQGYYQVRLTASNACGRSASDVRTVWIDGVFDALQLREPQPNAVVRLRACIEGTASDHLCFDQFAAEVRPAGGGTFVPVDPNHPFSSVAVANEPLAHWNTLGVPDGTYEVRLRGSTTCGNAASVTHPVAVDNTFPIAQLNMPLACTAVDGVVQIVGTVSDAHLAGWTLDRSDPSGTWVRLNQGVGPVSNGVLATWNTAGLPDCGYTLRLRAADSAARGCGYPIGNQSEALLSVTIGGGTVCAGDIDGDLDVDLGDLAILLSQYGNTCP